MLRIGVIVNPIAGVGGPAALKGSDGEAVQRIALERGAVPRAAERMQAAFAPLLNRSAELALVTWGGAMGAEALASLGFVAKVLGVPSRPSGAADTQAAARAMLDYGVDVLVFAGGDGTARDLTEVVPLQLPVIGIPAGVKMHSGVFGVTPRDVADVIALLLDGGLVAADVAEVRDVDEAALREGRVATRYYGQLSVPRVGGHLQHVKSSGREVEELVLAEVAEAVCERVASHHGSLILGPGSTVAAIKRRLGIEPTLLGFDVVRDGRLVVADADATSLGALVDADTVLVLSFTRGQGFLIGRGNQQLTPATLRVILRKNLWVVGSRTKLLSLEGRPLLVDTGDADLDARLCGVVEIISGYEDALFYRIGR
jgi:predicted polyphosphate/ATP-dependent NAD kinase